MSSYPPAISPMLVMSFYPPAISPMLVMSSYPPAISPMLVMSSYPPAIYPMLVMSSYPPAISPMLVMSSYPPAISPMLVMSSYPPAIEPYLMLPSPIAQSVAYRTCKQEVAGQILWLSQYSFRGYVEKQPLALKEYFVEYWLKELQEGIGRCSGQWQQRYIHNITEILLKAALNTIQLII